LLRSYLDKSIAEYNLEEGKVSKVHHIKLEDSSILGTLCSVFIHDCFGPNPYLLY